MSAIIRTLTAGQTATIVPAATGGAAQVREFVAVNVGFSFGSGNVVFKNGAGTEIFRVAGGSNFQVRQRLPSTGVPWFTVPGNVAVTVTNNTAFPVQVTAVYRLRGG